MPVDAGTPTSPRRRASARTRLRARLRGGLLRGAALGTVVVVALVSAGGGSRPAGPRTLDAAPVSLNDPAPPASLALTPADRQITASWPASTEASVRGYVVSVDGTARPEQAGLTATLTGLTNGRTYAVAVRTVTYDGGLVGIGAQGPFTGSQAATASTYPRDSVAPAAPAATTATAGDGQVTVRWTANTTDADVAGYVVHRGGTAVSGLLPPATTGWTDTGLTNDTGYTYTVRTQDTSRNLSADSPSRTATPTDLTAPAVPTGLSAVRGDRRVSLSWTASTETDLAGYRLYRDGTLVATVTAPATSYDSTGLTNDTAYAYAISAVDTHGNASAASSPAVSATPTDLTPPAAPRGLAATAGDGQVALSWTASPEPDLAAYRLYRDGALVATIAKPARTHTDTGLTDGTAYSYTLVAVDTHGNASPASAAVSATPADTTAPATPTGLTTTPGDAQVTVSWAASTEPDLAGYRLYRGPTVVATIAAPATTYTETHLTNGTKYTYALVAVDTSGNASARTPAAGATPVDAAPGAPTGLAAVRGDGRVALSWTANPEPDLAGYRVYRGGVLLTTVTAPTTTSTDTAVTNGTAYSYAVSAVDAGGNESARTTPVTATPTDLTPPAVPTGLVASRGDTTVSLTWTAGSDADLAAVRVLRDGAVVATLAGTSTGCTDTGLTDDQQYSYSLVAVDAAGNASAASSPVRATPTDLTPPPAPTGVSASAGDASAQVRWDAVTAPDLAAYRVLRADGSTAVTVPAPTTTATVTGLTDGVAVSLRVVAVDTHGNTSAPSAAVSATPADTTPPPVPTGVSATPADTAASVAWAAVSAPDLASYRVLQDGVVVATVPTGTTTTTVTGLANGTAYAFTVVAVDTAGNTSSASPTASATPAPATPADTTPPPPTSPPTSPPPPPPTSGVTPATGAGDLGGLAATRDGRYVVVGTRARLEGSDTNSAYELHLLDRTTGAARRVAPLPSTWSATSTTTDSTNSSAVALSADGRYLALATKAALAAADTNGRTDVYRLDLTTGTARLVSVPSGGAVSSAVDGTVTPTASGSNYATAPSVAISADGDRVLFYSARTDLVAGDASTAVGLFAKDMASGAVTRVSTTSSGGVLGSTVAGPALALTPDGRYALFPATASGGPLVLYRKDLTTKELVVVSTAVSASGTTTALAVSRDTGDVAISDDGRYVAFATTAKVGTSTPTSSWGVALAYRKDVVTGALAALGSGQTIVWEHQAALDPTGRYGFFETAAGEVGGDTNGHTDVHRRDLTTGALVLVTTDAAGAAAGPGPTGSVTTGEYGPVLALTGDTVLVATLQPLVAGDTNGVRDVYRKDLATGAVASAV